MDVHTLKIFIEVYKCKSFAQAAKSGFISRQGISSAIARFENELSCKLFIRTATGVEPTKEAVLLFTYAQQIVDLADECIFSLTSLLESHAQLEVYVAPGSIQEFAMNPIAEYMERFSSVGLRITDADDYNCESAVLAGKAEIALTPGPIDDTQFDSEFLLSIPNILVVNKTHPFAKKKQLAIADLQDVPVTIRNQSTKLFSNYYKACNRAGFNPLVAMYVTDSTLVFHMATYAQSVGISTLSLYEKLKSPHICAIPFEEPSLQWSLHIIKKKNTALSSYAKAFWDLVIEHRDKKI